MGLLGNGTKYNLAGRITTATTNLDGSNPSCIPAAYNLTAFRRNMLVSEAIKNPLASVPQGVRPPIAWMMAKEGGGISSYRRSDVRVSGTAAAEMGFPRSGAATLTLDGVAIGGLIVGATGSVTITLDGAVEAFGVITGDGSTTITIDGSAALGAIASLVGETTISLDGAAEIMALGYMSGTTIEAGLTPTGIANAVWSALLTQFQTDGTAGKALSTASSGGVDLNALAAAVHGYIIESGHSFEEVTRIMAAILAGKVSGAGTGTETFKGLDGVTDRVIVSVDQSGNRTDITLDGA